MIRKIRNKYCEAKEKLKENNPFRIRQTKLETTTIIPVTEKFDLKTTVQNIQIFLPFHFVTKMNFTVKFAAGSVDFTMFGADSALTNGIKITYAEKELFKIKKLQDLSDYSYRSNVFQDDQATKNIVVNTQIINRKLEEGIDVRYLNRQLIIHIQDDLSGSSNDEISLTVEGFTT